MTFLKDINGPLEAISNLTYLVEKSADDPAGVRMYTEMMEKQLSRIRRLYAEIS
jgi:hypothetical protein